MSEEIKNENSFCSFVSNFFHRRQQDSVRETIEDLIEEATADGDDQFSEHEQLLLQNILCLRNKKCAEAMIPRAEIVGFQKDGSLQDLAKLIISSGHSRIPVYGQSLDDIIGIFHVIDFVKCVLSGQKNCKLADVVSPNVKFVSPSMRVLDLLREMQLQKVHMAFVVDEYGGIDGLVTIEDLLEEIVGDIEDEYDIDQDPYIAVQENGEIIADATAELSEIKDTIGIDLIKKLDADEAEDVDTLGGFVFNLAQRIPSRGEVIEGPDGLKFRILEVDPRRIKKIMIICPAKDKKNDK